jgi:single-stranded DNA-binding protein
MNLVILTGFISKPISYWPTTPKRPRAMALVEIQVKNPYKPQRVVDWHTVVIYGKLAEACGRHLEERMMIQVVGCLTRSRWKDQAGTFHTVTQVEATAVNLCFHRASAEFLDAALLLAAEQTDDVEVEEDDDG